MQNGRHSNLWFSPNVLTL